VPSREGCIGEHSHYMVLMVRFLRCLVGYNHWDKERRVEIRSQLRMRKLDKQVHERNKNWLEHLQRMPSERSSKQLSYYRLIGRCDPGKRRKMVRWLDVGGRNMLTSSTIADVDGLRQ
jgi:hypothetical protein